jgi:FkbM family methyltransferase
MRIKRRIAAFAADGLIGAARRLGRQFTSYFVDRVMNNSATLRHAPTSRGDVVFWCPNETTSWRAQTLLTKEPETIEWIDGFSRGDVYWDIGANVGVYALYAGRRGDIRVLAFEPSPANYFALCRNVAFNEFGERVAAYCIAFNDVTKLDSLNMTTVEIGGALSSFGETKDFRGETFLPVARQTMLGLSVDDFMAYFSPPHPNHIKVDVDGIEGKIIEGASRTLADKRLKSVLIELDESRTDELKKVSGLLSNYGLSLQNRRHSKLVEQSEFATSYNYLFTREDRQAT